MDPGGASPEELLRLRLAVEASGEVIFMTDAHGTITYVNPEFVRVYGYTPAELVGRATPRILKSDATPAEEYVAYWQQLSERKVVRREFFNRTKAGATVAIESSANPIVMNDELVGFLAVQRDVTARRATEAALRESEARYRTLAEAAHDSIFIVNSDARIEYANAVSLERFGVEVTEHLGRELGDVLPPRIAEEMWRELSIVFSSGERRYFEARFDVPAGELWLGSWLVPMRRDGGATDAVMGVARDITDRKKLERQFAQAQKMEAIGRLAGGIAHDFNNLLTAIIGYSELLLDRVRDDAGLAADIEEIRKAGDKASHLTRQLLAFSRKQPSLPRLVDLNALVAELEKMLNRIIGEDIVLDIVADPQLAATKADPSQVEQVVVNLAVNARDAMPRGGALRIVTSNVELDADFVRRHEGAVPGSYVAMSVQDSGCGMTAEIAAQAFEPFFTTKPPGKGTGLGLSTVYGIVKQSGGYVTIDSQPGVGTAVTVYLPVAGETVADGAAAHSLPRAPSGTETIVLVEDDPGLRRLMRRTLEQLGYVVLDTESPADALLVLERHPGRIDLLLSDVIMPGLSGPDLARRALRARPSISVMYVSGFADSGSFRERPALARSCFLAKPFTPRTLATKVRECLDRERPAG